MVWKVLLSFWNFLRKFFICLRISFDVIVLSCRTLLFIFLLKVLKVFIRFFIFCRFWCFVGIWKVSRKLVFIILFFFVRRFFIFYCLLFRQLRKCWKFLYWDSIGWLVMWFIQRMSRRFRFLMKFFSKRFVVCFFGRWGIEMIVNLCRRRLQSQLKCLQRRQIGELVWVGVSLQEMQFLMFLNLVCLVGFFIEQANGWGLVFYWGLRGFILMEYVSVILVIMGILFRMKVFILERIKYEKRLRLRFIILFRLVDVRLFCRFRGGFGRKVMCWFGQVLGQERLSGGCSLVFSLLVRGFFIIVYLLFQLFQLLLLFFLKLFWFERKLLFLLFLEVLVILELLYKFVWVFREFVRLLEQLVWLELVLERMIFI